MADRVELPLVELAADALGDLVSEVVFVGAAILPALATDPVVWPLRETTDADCVIDVSTKARYDAFGERLRSKGLREDSASRVICRWRTPGSEMTIDVMPSKQSILGFSGGWMSEAHRPEHISNFQLASGRYIRAVRAPLFTAMKIEAFESRGRNDFLASKDFEDLVSLVRGRSSLGEEIAKTGSALRAFIVRHLDAMSRQPQFATGVEGAVRGPLAAATADDFVIPRFQELASIGIE